MIYVTHRLDEVMEIADDVVVMRDGFKVAEGERKKYALRDLVKLIVGREKGGDMRHAESVRDRVLLSADGLSVGDTGPVSFAVKQGEMLALAGLRGAGQEEIGRALFGLRGIGAGRLTLTGGDYRPRSAAEAIGRGVNMLAGDRTAESPCPSTRRSGNRGAGGRSSGISTSVPPSSTSTSAPCPAGTSRRSSSPAG